MGAIERKTGAVDVSEDAAGALGPGPVANGARIVLAPAIGGAARDHAAHHDRSRFEHRAIVDGCHQGVEAELRLHPAGILGLHTRGSKHLADEEIGPPAEPPPIRGTAAGVVVAHRERLVLH